MRDVSEVAGEWPVDTEVAQTQITTFVRASVASDPQTPWTLRRWRTSSRNKSALAAFPASEEQQTAAPCCTGFKLPGGDSNSGVAIWCEHERTHRTSTYHTSWWSINAGDVWLLAVNDQHCFKVEAQMNIVTQLLYFLTVVVFVQSPGSTSTRRPSGRGWTALTLNWKYNRIWIGSISLIAASCICRELKMCGGSKAEWSVYIRIEIKSNWHLCRVFPTHCVVYVTHNQSRWKSGFINKLVHYWGQISHVLFIPQLFNSYPG